MRGTDDLMDLRGERLELLQKLDACSNPQRQKINKRLTNVSKKIQRLSSVCLGPLDRGDL